ncbi:MAG: hypothetical protein MHMPM18_000133 [Marteilia pararefringens]
MTASAASRQQSSSKDQKAAAATSNVVDDAAAAKTKSAAVSLPKTMVLSGDKKATVHKNSAARLYVKAHFLGYRRGMHHQYPNFSLLQIDSVHNAKDANYYVGKTTYCALKTKKGKKDIVKGKIVRIHGKSGVVMAKFESNLPHRVSALRVMMYPTSS